ncbi:hypothetical protein F511_44793 [Dorcoceras hygrometricum]|uniref:Uncharacterized protein n=1 Tax=Dorcoceras hygrometricum TaxID=472368 RepID=A0A2Z7A4Y6_9LAMI|nr:hypothetical protein F511_44793 [Dorcoceras hygrometricum]
MVKRLATSPHDPLGITDSACKNQSIMVSIQYGPFNTYIPIRSTTIGKSRVARDPMTMHTSWRSNSDIACVTRVSMTFRVLRTNQYIQDLGLIHSTNGNHLESPNEGSSIYHQIGVAPLPPAIAFGKAASARSYNWYQSQGRAIEKDWSCTDTSSGKTLVKPSQTRSTSQCVRFYLREIERTL